MDLSDILDPYLNIPSNPDRQRWIMDTRHHSDTEAAAFLMDQLALFKRSWPDYSDHAQDWLIHVNQFLQDQLPISLFPKLLGRGDHLVLLPEIRLQIGKDLLSHFGTADDTSLLMQTLTYLREIRTAEGALDPSNELISFELISFRLLSLARDAQIPIDISLIDAVLLNGHLDWEIFSPFLLEIFGVMDDSQVTPTPIKDHLRGKIAPASVRLSPDLQWDVIAEILRGLNPTQSVCFSNLKLAQLTINQVQQLPDTLQVRELDLSATQIRPEVLIPLLLKFNPTESVLFTCVNLSQLTVDQVQQLPDTMKVHALDLRYTRILPEVLIALLCKVTPTGLLDLVDVDLSELTVDQVQQLPDTLKVQKLNLRGTQIRPQVLIALLRKVTPTGLLDLGDVDLSELTVDQVQQLPDTLKVQKLDLGGTQIRPQVLITLLRKINPTESFNLESNDLSELTVDHVQQLPDTFQIRELNLCHMRIRPGVLIALLCKFNPTESVHLENVYLSQLTVDHVQQLPDTFQIRDLNLCNMRIRPEVLIALLCKFNPTKSVNLKGVDLSALTIELVKQLPDHMQVRDLNLCNTRIRPEVLIALLCKLNPTESVNLIRVDLSQLTVEHVQPLPDTFQIRDLNLCNTRIRPEVLIVLLCKFNPTESVNLEEVDLSSLTVDQVQPLSEPLQRWLRDYWP